MATAVSPAAESLATVGRCESADDLYAGKKSRCSGAVCVLGCLSLVPGVTDRIVSRVAFFPPQTPSYVVKEEPRPQPGADAAARQAGGPSGARRRRRGANFMCWAAQAPAVGGSRGSAHSSSSSSADGADELFPPATVYLVTKPGVDGSPPQVVPLPRQISIAQPEIDGAAVADGSRSTLKIHVRHLRVPSPDTPPIHAFLLTHRAAKLTCIFSHGNSTDIGRMFLEAVNFVRKVRTVNLLFYDYTGYGASEGVPSEANTYSNIRAVYRFAETYLRLQPEQIVLYGQSVGSAPSIDLAVEIPGLGGLIVHSGMVSGLTVLRPKYDRVHWFDPFNNRDKIRKVRCKILLIHGKNDTEVPFSHGLTLAANAPHAESWWVANAGHNNIEQLCGDEYYGRLRSFFASVGGVAVSKLPLAALSRNGGGAGPESGLPWNAGAPSTQLPSFGRATPHPHTARADLTSLAAVRGECTPPGVEAAKTARFESMTTTTDD